MKQKKKFFQKSTIVRRVLSLVLTLAMVLTMGMFPQLDIAATEGTDGNSVLIVHFKNEKAWDTVYAKFGSGGNWDAIPGYEDAAQGFGVLIAQEESNDDWYTYKVDEIPDDVTVVNGLFNKGEWNNDSQTDNQTSEYAVSIQGSTEAWVTYTDKDSKVEVSYAEPEGWTECTADAPVNLNAKSSIQSPVVNEDKTVTFRFDASSNYADAEDVRLMGTLKGTDWDNGLAMKKGEDGTWSVTTPVQSSGVYEYKFKIGNDWLTDPLNSQTSGGNSKVVVAGLTDASVDAVKGESTVLPETLALYKEDGNKEDVAVTYALADEALADKITISDGSITIEKDADVETVVLNASYGDQKSKVTVSVKGAIYTYNIYYFDQMASHMDIDAADIWAWEEGGGNLDPIPFTSLETLADGKEWLKATLMTSATSLGLIPRSKGTWNWQTGNHYFKNTEKSETCDIYIIQGDDDNTYTELPKDDVKEQRKRCVIVEYVRPNGDYEGWNIYSWNTGFGGETELYTEVVNGRRIITVPVADYDVDLLLAFCMRQTIGEDAWAEKDGGDHYLNVPADQIVVKAKFVQGEGITEILPYNTGYELDGANDQIRFYYRDDALFQKNMLDTLQGKVQIVVEGETFDMEYDAVNERYYYDYKNVATGEYSYHYVVDGKEVIDVFNPNTTEDGKDSVLTYEMYDVAITAAVLNPTMDYNDNNVLSVSFTGVDADKITTEEIAGIEADLSALGLGTLEIDPELMKASIACLYSTAAGEKKIPVTLKDIYGNRYEATASVTVTKRVKAEGDFDWDEAIIYFAVTDRFFDGNTGNNEGVDKDGSLSYHGGDFAGLNQKLDYLKELGVNTIWITPIVENSDTSTDKDGSTVESTGYHGYWASDFTKLNSHLGTPEEFSALLDAAHERGIKIMVDVVINHAGYNTEDYFNSMIKDADGNDVPMIRDSSNTVSGSDVYASLAGLPDFVTENEAVRNQLIEWQTDWMDKYDIDYYRIDTVKHVDDTTWSAFKNSLAAASPAFKMTGEYAGAGFANNAGELSTGRMDALLDFDFNDFASDFVTGNISSVESSLLKRNEVLNNTATMSSFLNSHDENGLQYTLQDNKGLSEAEARDLMKVAASLMITAKGQPVIYYGEEIGQYGQDNYPYQTNRYDFDWKELADQQADSSSIYNHYKTMLAIRNKYTDVFTRGDRQSVKMSDTEGYDVFSRSYDGTTLYIGMNVSSEARILQIPIGGEEGSVYTNLYDKAYYTVAADQTISVVIPAAKDGGTVVLIAGGDKTVSDGWMKDEDGNQYWYEDGVKQGTEGRGKEIYDSVSDAWYWLDAVDGGKVAVSKDVYLESAGGRLAENANGTGKWVRYDENGHMVKGWNVTEEGTWYFDTVYGTMAKGYVVLEGDLYYFDWITGIGTGEPCGRNEINGWVIEEDGSRYWYDDGVKQGIEGRGKEIYDPISDAWYWLDAVDGGRMAVNKNVYIESYAGGWAEHADGTGKWVRYDENGHMVKGWDTTEEGTRYYDLIYGTMAKGTVTIDGAEYSFDIVTGIQIGK